MMDEAAACRLALASSVSRETYARLERMVALVVREAKQQNLIAESTLHAIWARHVVDSLQLLSHAPAEGSWLDVGAGAGFPGLAIAAATHREVILVEPRARRAAFLRHAVEALGLKDQAQVIATRIETAAPLLATKPAIITARAVAPLDRLFAMTTNAANAETHWVLPKGRSAREELAAACTTWQGDFRLLPSITDPEAAIVVATRVRPRKRR